MQPRYLTKSKFKLAIECPTKLYYAGKKEYYNNKSEDDWMQELARGGIQVGILAKKYFPNLSKVAAIGRIERANAKIRKQFPNLKYKGGSPLLPTRTTYYLGTGWVD